MSFSLSNLFSLTGGPQYVKERRDIVGNGTRLAIFSTKLGRELKLYPWNPNARLQVTGLKSAVGSSGDANPEDEPGHDDYKVPAAAKVFRPSKDEIYNIIAHAEGVGRFADATILPSTAFADSTDNHGAIEVIDITSGSAPSRGLYYQPAPLQRPPSHKPEGPHDLFFVFMAEETMPSFYYWKAAVPRPLRRKPGATTVAGTSYGIDPADPIDVDAIPPTITATTEDGATSHVDTVTPTGVGVHPREPFDRSAAPSPAANSPTAGKDTRGKTTAGLVIDTAAKRVRRAAAPKDLLRILDKHNEKSFGRPCIRMKREWPSEFVEREYFKTSCLPPIDLTKIAPPTAEQLKTAPVIEEISDNDEAFVHFKKKLARRERIRKARMHPKSQYDSNVCNELGEKDTLKRNVSIELFKELERRVVGSETTIHQRELEGVYENNGRDATCRICHGVYKSMNESMKTHHAMHRDAYRERRPYAPAHPRSTFAKTTDSMAPTLAEFRQLEARVLLADNELLEREEVCIACGSSLQFGSKAAAKHYQEHQREWEEHVAAFDQQLQELSNAPTSERSETQRRATDSQSAHQSSTSPAYHRTFDWTKPSSSSSRDIEPPLVSALTGLIPPHDSPMVVSVAAYRLSSASTSPTASNTSKRSTMLLDETEEAPHVFVQQGGKKRKHVGTKPKSTASKQAEMLWDDTEEEPCIVVQKGSRKRKHVNISSQSMTFAKEKPAKKKVKLTANEDLSENKASAPPRSPGRQPPPPRTPGRQLPPTRRTNRQAAEEDPKPPTASSDSESEHEVSRPPPKKPGHEPDPLRRAGQPSVARCRDRRAQQASSGISAPTSTPIIPRTPGPRPTKINTKVVAPVRRRRPSEETYVDKTPSPPLSVDPSPKIPKAPKKNPDGTYRPHKPVTPTSPTPTLTSKKAAAKKPVAKAPAALKPVVIRPTAMKSATAAVATSSVGERVLRSRVVKLTARSKRTTAGKGTGKGKGKGKGKRKKQRMSTRG